MLAIWDTFFYVFWLILPVLILVKWRNWKGVLFAAFVFYVLSVGEGSILATFDPTRLSFIDAIWFTVGIPASLFYSFVIFITLNLIKNFKKTRKLPIWFKIVLLILAICITPIILFILILFFTTDFGRITDFKPITDKESIEKTAYFFEFQKPADLFKDTIIDLKNRDSSATLKIGSFLSVSKSPQTYTTFSANGKLFLIISSPDDGSRGGNSYDVYNISSDEMPSRSLNPPGNEFFGGSCVPPKPIGNQLELTTQGSCEMFPLSSNDRKNYYIPLKDNSENNYFLPIKTDSSPISEIRSSQKNGWETYVNKEGKFQIDYPSSLLVIEQEFPKLKQNNFVPAVIMFCTHKVDIRDDVCDQGLTIEYSPREEKGGGCNQGYQSITFAGQKKLMCLGTDYSNQLYASHPQGISEVNVSSQFGKEVSKAEILQMLSSFSFITETHP